MKVLAFNSSPRMDNGNTHLILTPFLDGMRVGYPLILLFVKDSGFKLIGLILVLTLVLFFFIHSKTSVKFISVDRCKTFL
jgi:hypothetical protein